MDDSGDILGGTLHAKPPSSIPILVKAPLYLSAGLALWLGFVWLWNWIKAKQEINYRLATRRKHGIPDDDRRPFNVAYAAVSRARQGREREREKARREAEVAAEAEAKNDIAWTTAVPLNSTRSQPVVNFAGPSRLIQNMPVVQPHLPSPAPSITSERPAAIKHRAPRIHFEPSHEDADRRKRALDDEEYDHEHAKKTRVEGEELIDGDEDSRFHAEGGKRAAKRVLGDGEEGRVADKRRKQRVVEVVDVDEDEEMGEPVNKVRGQKRDRGAGGDEEEEVREDEKSRKGHKRRTMQKRKSDVAEKRGKKRDRDVEDVDSPEEGEDEPLKRSSKKKRGKKSTVVVEEEKEDRNDVSMDSPMSKDPLCKGKKIGEEWEVSGVRYKVGPNGDRLRQSLVKKARSKFIMPEDSQHPDRQAHMEVFVETWLTEAQYKDAKERHQLAWQVSPKASFEPEATTKAPAQSPPSLKIPETTPTSQGKNLLWSSTTSSHSPSPHGSPRPLRQSLTTNIFTSRRVASAYVNPVLGYGDSNNGSPMRGQFRSFSKWEKQDLEAEAMRKMRTKLEEQKKKDAAALAPPPITTSVSLPAPTPIVASNATVSFAKLDEKKEKEVRPAISMPSISFVPPTPTTVSTPPPAAGTGDKPAPLFGPPATTTPLVTKPTTENATKAGSTINLFSSAPQGNAQPQAPSFSFPKPNQQPPLQQLQAPPSSAPASNSVSHFFSNKMAPASTPAPAAPTAPASEAQQVKPQSSFVWPSSAQTTSGPAPGTTSSFGQPQTQSWGTNKTQESAPTSMFGGEQKKPEQTQAGQGGGSLLSRMGAFSENASGTKPASNPPASSTNTGSSSFTFGKPSTQTDTPQGPPPAPASNAGAPPKFSFGFPNKPANASPSPAPVVGSSTPTAPLTTKPTATSFTFPTKESSTTGGTGSTPIFSFGVNPSGSAFGKTNTAGSGQTTGTGSSSTPATKSAFSGFGGGTSGNAFGTTTPAGSPATGNLFGGGNSASSGGQTGNIFGGAGTAATSSGDQPSKPTFGFGVPSSGSDQSKPSFGFGTPTSTPSATTTGEPQNKPTGSFTFQFGGGGQSSGTPTTAFGTSASTTNPPSLFGQPSNSAPSAFSFGSSSSNTGGQNQQQK